MTGLPIFEMTTPANVLEHKVALEMLEKTNAFLSIKECYFIGNQTYDTKAAYMADFLTRTAHAKSFVVPSNAPNPVVEPQTTKTGTTARKIVVAPNASHDLQ